MSHMDTGPSARSTDWKATILAGLIAGLVFIVMEMVLVPLVGGGSPLGPPKMIAGILLGPDVLPMPDVPPTFDLSIFLIGMIVHFVLAVVLAIIFVLIINRMNLRLGAAIGAGAVFGLAVYVVNFYGFTAIWPWFEMARNAITIVSHLAFGAVLAWAYFTLARTSAEI